MYDPQIEDTGWRPDLKAELRIAFVLKYFVNEEKAAQALQKFANTSKDYQARQAAVLDTITLLKLYQRKQAKGKHYLLCQA